MSVTHRTFDGGWALCAAPDVCELRFHFPDVIPAQMALVPEQILWDMCDIVDPPVWVGKDGIRYWWCTAPGNDFLPGERGYDLPGERHPDGSAFWVRNGLFYRGHDRPSVIDMAAGTVEWIIKDQHHRAGGLPAVLRWGGRVEYWLEGYQLSGDRIVHREADGRWTWCVQLAGCAVSEHVTPRQLPPDEYAMWLSYLRR